MKLCRFSHVAPFFVLLVGCHGPSPSPASPGADGEPSLDSGSGVDVAGDVVATTASLPLVAVADVDLPGKAVRFDYQDFDVAKGHLVIAHMNDASVVVVNTSDGSVVKVLPGIPTARGVIVADDVGRIFVTSSPNKLVIIDNSSL